MIFQHTLEKIINCEKTQTRRIVYPRDTAIRVRNNKISSVIVNGRAKWTVGQTYAVQPGRGQPQVARIQILRIRSEHLERISTADAKAEGFASRKEFLQAWQSIHSSIELKSRVWVVEFELVSIELSYMNLLMSTSALRANAYAT